MSEPTATEVVAEVPAEFATPEAVVEAPVAEVPAQDVTTEEVVEPQEAAAEDKPAN
uniref:hypothetical protein n=1 Tax=Candidatus Planktophila sp. TaxID=2175601 RepID=UPI00404AE8EF